MTRGKRGYSLSMRKDRTMMEDPSYGWFGPSREANAMSTQTTQHSTHNVTVDNGTQVAKTHFTTDRQQTRHITKTVDGHEVTVNAETHTDDTLSGEFDNRVMTLINGVITEREQRENERANHRNLNRMLTLFGALLIGLVVTWVLTNGMLGSSGKVLAPYAFVITILMDSGLALYGYIRHY